MNDMIMFLGNLEGLKLQPLSIQEPSIELIEVNLTDNKLIIQSENRKNPISRDLKIFQEIFKYLEKNKFCCIDDIIKLNNSALYQVENILANLPFIEYFNYNKKLYFFYSESLLRSYGTIAELQPSIQYLAKRAINNTNKINYASLTHSVAENIIELNSEVEKIHLLSPGILSNTNIRNVLSNFDYILSEINSTQFNPKKNEAFSAEKIKLTNVDMSDIIDMPEITGIDSGDNSYLSNDDFESEFLDNEKNDHSLIVPNIRRQTPSLALLYERLLFDEIEIQPEYQRKDRIWSEDKKCKLIESILMQLPLPIFYFGERKDDTWVVIDGLQRITTVQDFMKNKFPLKLDKNSSVYEMNGLTFQEFSRNYTRLLREFEITAYVIDLQENDDSNKFIIELFHRINTYGVKLSDQEIRSAINFGSSVFYLKYLASSKLFLSATTNTISDKRQKDLELCLGALSYIIFGYKSFNYNRYDSFLGSTMKWINKQTFKKVEKDGEVYYQSDSPVITNLTNKFEKGLRFSREIFGRDAFKKGQNTTNRDPISKPLFESFVSIFANISENDFELIKANKNIFLDTLYKAISNDSREYAKWNGDSYINSERGLNYSLSSSTGKRVTILYRFDSIIQILEKTTGCTIHFEPILGEL